MPRRTAQMPDLIVYIHGPAVADIIELAEKAHKTPEEAINACLLKLWELKLLKSAIHGTLDGEEGNRR